MNKTIWKFELKITDTQDVKMPSGTKILSVQNQNNKACLWGLLVPNGNNELRTIEIFGTGSIIPYDGGVERVFIGTIQDGTLVWHVFERIN